MSRHPYGDHFSLRTTKKGEFSDTNSQYVQDKFKKFHVSDRITILPGLFEYVLIKKLVQKHFSLVFIDCNLYVSTKYAPDFLSSRVTPKGQIVLHDYGYAFWGLTKAVNESCIKKRVRVTP